MIYSWHDDDPVDSGSLSRHRVRGTVSLNLIGGLQDPPPDPTNLNSFKIAVENVSNGTRELGNQGIREPGNQGTREPGNQELRNWGTEESGNWRTEESGNWGTENRETREPGNQGTGELGNQEIMKT